jgi:hypothetical protein
MYTIDKSNLVKGPGFSAKSLGVLAANTRLEVSDPANRSYLERFSGDWRRVTVMDGPHTGKVGWVLARSLMKGDN